MKVDGASFSGTVSAVVQASDMVPGKQEAFYSAFVGSGCMIPMALREDWLELVELCRTNDSDLAEAAKAVPVEWEPYELAVEAKAAAGAEQSFAHYLGQKQKQSGPEAAWAGAILSAARERPDWLDRSVAAYAASILRDDIAASPELTKELGARVVAVLVQEFRTLKILLEKAGRLERRLDTATASPSTFREDAFTEMATALKAGDSRFETLLLESELAVRYESLIHPESRGQIAGQLRGELWGSAPRVDYKSDTPIAQLFEDSVFYVSSRISKVLGQARGFGIRPN